MKNLAYSLRSCTPTRLRMPGSKLLWPAAHRVSQKRLQVLAQHEPFQRVSAEWKDAVKVDVSCNQSRAVSPFPRCLLVVLRPAVDQVPQQVIPTARGRPRNCGVQESQSRLPPIGDQGGKAFRTARVTQDRYRLVSAASSAKRARKPAIQDTRLRRCSWTPENTWRVFPADLALMSGSWNAH